MEKFNKYTALIIEGHQFVEKRSSDLENKIDKMANTNDMLDFMRIMHKDLNSKIDQSAEKLDKKIDNVAQKLDNTDKKLSKRIDQLDKKMDTTEKELKGDIQQLDKKIDTVDKKIDTVHNELKEDIHRVETKIDTITDTYADHEERLTIIERALHN